MTQTDEILITEEMLDNLRLSYFGRVSDIDVLRLLSRKMKCENIAVYDRVMDYCSQLHISAYSTRDELTITT